MSTPAAQELSRRRKKFSTDLEIDARVPTLSCRPAQPRTSGSADQGALPAKAPCFFVGRSNQAAVIACRRLPRPPNGVFATTDAQKTQLSPDRHRLHLRHFAPSPWSQCSYAPG